MIRWKELKERRIVQMTVAYVAVGWVALSVLAQFVERGLFPEIVYRLGLVLYVGGIPAALIMGWYHGEKGRQKVSAPEVALLTLVFLVTSGIGGLTWRGYRQEQMLAASLGLDSAYDARRVAVLYFDAGGDEGELGAVADGLTEALIDELSRVRALDLVSRNGVAPYRETTLSADSIGRALGAGSVIMGSVERLGDALRLNVRLVDAESGVDIDRTAFSMPTDELLQARDSLVALTSEFLRARLGDEVSLRSRRAETTSVDAWTHVQRAERLRKEAETARRSDAAQALALTAQADSLLRVAEALDPAWTEPVALRAQLAVQQAAWARGVDAALAAVQAGVALADRAIGLNTNHAGAWEARGTLRYFHYFLNVSPTPDDRAALLNQAQQDLERAVSLDPDLASALNTLSRLHYDRRDRLSAALAARQALQADSYLRDAAATYDRLFWAHYDLGQFAEAGRTCSEAAARVPLDSRFRLCGLWMMITPTAEADPDAAWEILAQVDSLTAPDRRPFVHSQAQMIVGGVLARASLPDSARHVLDNARAGPDVDPGQELIGYEAIMRTILGEHDVAVQQLRRYVAAHPDHQFLEVEGDVHWWWRPLRGHPEFATVAARNR